MPKPNDNREEEIPLEDEEDREEELDNSADGEEEEDDSTADEGEEEDENEEDAEEEDESDDDSDGEDEDDEEDGDPMAKFKGKTPEQLIEMYKNLESSIDKRALTQAQKLLERGGFKKKDGTKPTKKELDDFEEELKKQDFSKMQPAEFARWMHQRVMIEATRIAQATYERSNEIKRSVTKEISEATKAHPHLKENESYREVVISMIEAASARGETMTLKEACAKADKAMGLKPGKPAEKKEEDGKEKKKPKLGVEKPEGGGGGDRETEEDKVKKGLLGIGSSSGLGGLGV